MILRLPPYLRNDHFSLWILFAGVKERNKIPKFSEFLRHRRKPARHKKENDDFLPEQFQVKCRPVPWKAIGYAIGLFVLGTALLIAGCLIHTGHVDNEVYWQVPPFKYFFLKTKVGSKKLMCLPVCYNFRNMVTVCGLS